MALAAAQPELGEPVRGRGRERQAHGDGAEGDDEAGQQLGRPGWRWPCRSPTGRGGTGTTAVAASARPRAAAPCSPSSRRGKSITPRTSTPTTVASQAAPAGGRRVDVRVPWSVTSPCRVGAVGPQVRTRRRRRDEDEDVADDGARPKSSWRKESWYVRRPGSGWSRRARRAVSARTRSRIFTVDMKPEHQHDGDDRAQQRQGDAAEGPPGGCAVEGRRLVQLARDLLETAVEDHHVEGDADPDVDQDRPTSRATPGLVSHGTARQPTACEDAVE